MSTLKELAKQGHTVVCVIHQPRSSIYGEKIKSGGVGYKA
jgi:hypothetical protein